MGFFNKISKPFKKIGKAISGIVRDVHDVIMDPLGLKSLGQNIPTSYSLQHNINLEGKIDATVNVKTNLDVDVGVDINLKDLVTAATIFKDAISNFDIFGGLIRQHVNDISQTHTSMNLLHELRDIIAIGSTERKRDEYYFVVSLINDSTQYDTNNKNLFITKHLCRCLLSIELNKQCLLDDIELQIKKFEVPVTSPLRAEHQVVATNISKENLIKFTVKQHPSDIKTTSGDANTPSADTNPLKNCRLQVRLIRETQYWKYTLIEWIFDGESGPSEFSGKFVVEHPYMSPSPLASNKANKIIEKIDHLITVLSTPNIAKDIDFSNSEASNMNNISVMMQKTLFESYQSRVSASKSLEKALMELEDDNPNTFDVRTPFVAAVSCHSGPITVRINSGSGVNLFPAIQDEQTLNTGDEIAIRIPLYAGQKVNRDDIIEQIVRFDIHSLPGQSGYCTVTVYSGFEWATEIVNSKTIWAKAKDQSDKAISHEVKIKLSDALAN